MTTALKIRQDRAPSSQDYDYWRPWRHKKERVRIRGLNRGMHKPIDGGVSSRQSSERKVARMLTVLQGHKWNFKFKVEALSPRGFRYEAEGATREEAVLKAFGMLESTQKMKWPDDPQT
jgi:hypothetical protein